MEALYFKRDGSCVHFQTVAEARKAVKNWYIEEVTKSVRIKEHTIRLFDERRIVELQPELFESVDLIEKSFLIGAN